MRNAGTVPLVLFLTLSSLSAQTGEEIQVPTRDGSLDALLYVPEGEGPWPCILVQTPYGKERSLPEGILGADPGREDTPDLAGLGDYAVLVVDWRTGANVPRRGGGRGRASGGRQQREDGFDTVAWIAAQPWSDGQVATWGPSALGGVQYRTAEAQPPALVCMVPMVRDLTWTYGLFFPGGVERLEYLDALDRLYSISDIFRQHPRRDVFWRVVESAHQAERIEVPALVVGGWFDIHAAEQFRSFELLRTRSDPAVREQHRLLVGPWEHMNLGKVEQGELAFPQAAILRREVRRWFDLHLRGGEGPHGPAPICVYVIHSDVWLECASWPPAAVEPRALHLVGDALREEEPTEAVRLRLPHRPADPSPTLGGNNLSPELLHGPADQRQVEARDDVLVFSGAPLRAPLTLDGQRAPAGVAGDGGRGRRPAPAGLRCRPRGPRRADHRRRAAPEPARRALPPSARRRRPLRGRGRDQPDRLDAAAGASPAGDPDLEQ